MQTSLAPIPKYAFHELPIGLAPMEGVTVLPMRIWFHLVAAPRKQATPFLRVTTTYPHGGLPPVFAPELDELSDVLPYELVPQLMAAEADDFLRVAPSLLDFTEFVELNCGCPSPTCVGKGAGSSLLRDATEFGSMISTISRELGPKRFAVKMRTGFQAATEFETLLGQVRELGLARLTVHGRTRPDRYRGLARWDLIEQAARETDTSVVASGDVVDLKSLQEKLQLAPNISEVIVGRGALRNPWIFTELRTLQPVRLSFEVLRLALLCHALLHELMASDSAAVFALAKVGTFVDACGTDFERWMVVYQKLAALVWPGMNTSPEAPGPVTRVTLGRLKMLWNYLRSSLPEPFFAPAPLRAGSLADFLTHVAAAHIACGSPASLALLHNPSLDWLYSGEKKTKDENETLS